MFDPVKPYNELPPITTLDLSVSKELAKLAEDTRVAIELLKYAARLLPNQKILLETLALQEARASSNIENIVTTNDDLYRGIIFESYTAEAKEVSRYKEALDIGFKLIGEKRRLASTDLEEINRLISSRGNGIRQNLPNFHELTRIKRILESGEAEIIYTPPHGWELLQTLLIDMLEYVYNDDIYDVHPLIKIALAHYQFESIHPFRDGNGRTGRILNVLFLCQKDYLDYPILYASSYIIQNKTKYYDLLRTTKETQDYGPIVAFMLRSFKETAEYTLRIVESIHAYLNEYSDKDYLRSLKGQMEPLQQTVELIFKKVYVRIADLVDLGIHRQTAAAYLDQFVDQGLLSKEKVGKDNIYKNIKLLEMFDYEKEGLQ